MISERFQSLTETTKTENPCDRNSQTEKSHTLLRHYCPKITSATHLIALAALSQ